MAAKGMKDLLGSFFGRRPGQPKSVWIRNREKAIIARLGSIRSGMAHGKLSDKEIRALNIPGVIDFACAKLHYPSVSYDHARQLDESLGEIVNALDLALQEGLETTARQACAVLILFIPNLDISDPEYSGELEAFQVRYAQRLAALMAPCMEFDRRSQKIKQLRSHQAEFRAEFDRRKADHEARRNAGELEPLIVELRENMHNSAALSDAALKLQDELRRLHTLKNTLFDFDTAIHSAQDLLSKQRSLLQKHLNTLNEPPQIQDPSRHNRLQEAYRRYREHMGRALDEAIQAARDYGIRFSALDELYRHSRYQTQTTMGLIGPDQEHLERLRMQVELEHQKQMHDRAVQSLESILEENLLRF